MMHRCMLLLCVATSTVAQDLTTVDEVPVADVQGRVVDAQGAAVANASVVLCNAESGIPVMWESYEIFPRVGADIERGMERIACAPVDGTGHFEFPDVPFGTYRLIAQSWSGDEARDQDVTRPLEVNGSAITLHGSAHLDIQKRPLEPITIQPLGTLTLDVEIRAANDQNLLVVSTSTQSGDPILGFAGWTGPFMRDMVCANRMPQGKTTIHGLPPGTYHIGIFSADNNPGWAAATVELEPETRTRTYLHFVASWSDAVHEPKPSLEPLVDYINSIDLKHPMELFKWFDGPAFDLQPARHPLAQMAQLGPHLDRTMILPDGSRKRAADVIAAAAYGRMAEMLKEQGRIPNPYEAPEVERTPIKN